MTIMIPQMPTILRIDYCDEQSDYYSGDISGPKDGIHISNRSTISPDISLFNDMT